MKKVQYLYVIIVGMFQPIKCSPPSLRCQTGLHSVNRDTRPPRPAAAAPLMFLLGSNAGLGWAGLGWLGCNRRGYTSNTPPHSQHRILWPRRGLVGAQSSIPFFLPFEGQLDRTWATHKLTFREASSQKPILDLIS